MQRLRRMTAYFGKQRKVWALAIAATAVAVATEPMIPATLKYLLDQGFTADTLPLWMVPLSLVGLFTVRGIANFIGQYALTRIANDGMLELRQAMSRCWST